MEICIPVFGILLSVFIGIITAKLFQINFPQLICIPVKETLIVFGAFLLILLLLCFLEDIVDIVRTWMFFYRLCTSFLILLVLVMLGIWLRKEKTNAIEETSSSTQRLLSSPKFSIRKKQYSRQISRRSNNHYNTLKSWSQKRERDVEINYDMELQKGYVQAICFVHTDITVETIKKAMRYMNAKVSGCVRFLTQKALSIHDGYQKGIFTAERRNAEVVLKIIEHIENLQEWAKNLGRQTIPGKEFPKELTRKKIEDLLIKMKFGQRSEIKIILQQTFSKYGFYPIPKEFCEIYLDKKDELMKTRKRQRTENNILKSEINNLKQEVVTLKQYTIPTLKHKQLIGGLEKEVADLKQRLNCKICMQRELGVKVLPCNHVFSCRECFEMIPKTSCIICKMVIENTEVFCLP